MYSFLLKMKYHQNILIKYERKVPSTLFMRQHSVDPTNQILSSRVPYHVEFFSSIHLYFELNGLIPYH